MSRRYPLHLNPWLEKTKWAEYLAGQSLEAVAALLAPPKLEEAGLRSLLQSFDALVSSARLSVLSEEVNVFALHRIRSFVRGRSYEKPLHTKLLESTYRRYQTIWHQLLSYIYRLAINRQGPNLHYVLTPAQGEALSQLITCDATVRPSPQLLYPPMPPSPSLQGVAATCPSHLRQQHPTKEQVSNSLDNSEDGKTDLIAPTIRQSPLYDTSLASPAITSGAVGDLSRTSRLNDPFTWKETTRTNDSATVEEQQRCLDLCIALLDQKLHGKLTESILVGFLAALGINRECNGFEDPVSYTPKLSALVKIAQLLIAQHAVIESKAGHTQFPNEFIAEMQDRFMVYGSESPMNWILNLRAYGAKLRDNTTCLGFVEWSDDGQKLCYKSLELTMNGLRWFLRDQVHEAQRTLHGLLLIPKIDQDRHVEHLPQIHLNSLKDDPTVHHANYSFLQDRRNEQILGGYQRYILRCIKTDAILRRQFFTNFVELTWDMRRVRSYVQLVQAFLRQLLLLVHVTGGQPARGTELLTLRWRNSDRCEMRNVFIEHGLVSFVTSYHKNYSTSSITKLVHRYLPPEVSELLVYYLWLVVPFVEQLQVLTQLQGLSAVGSFLWPASLNVKASTKPRKETQTRKQTDDSCEGTEQIDALGVEEPWKSARLGAVIKEEFKRGLQTTASTPLWRHASIAISRRHLPEGSKFKRDYGPEERSTAMDLQAAHTSRMAGNRYARDLREGPGQAASLRAEFRLLSRNWHTCMGFGVPLAPRDVPNSVGNNTALSLLSAVSKGFSTQGAGHKRSREEVEEELNSWLRTESVLRTKKVRLARLQRGTSCLVQKER
jgi:hypothetical protein